MFAEIRDTTLYYEIIGTGEPLFLLPGGPGGDSNIYKSTHLPLAENNQLILFDPRGCGHTPPSSPEMYHVDQYIEDVEALRQFLGFKKINVLGKSYGGIAGQAYALKYQDVLNKLILVATEPSYLGTQDAFRNLNKIGTDEQKLYGNKLLRGELVDQAEVNHAMNVLSDLYSDKEKIAKQNNPDKTWNVSLAHGPLTYGFKTFLHSFDYTPDLHKITQPTLIIAGDHDWVCDPKYSRILHEKIPHSELLILDSGHKVDSDQTEQYLAAVSEFL